MIANINPITKIPYGVIDARKCNWLWEHIVGEGRDVTAEGYEKHVREDLTEYLSYDLGKYEVDVGSFAADGNTQFLNFLKPILAKVPVCQKPEDIHELATYIVQNRYDPVSNTFSISEVVDLIWDHYADDMLQQCYDDASEHTFYWVDGKYSYQVSSLGGAPLIWVLNSPYVTPCRQCSPCIRNAGNLDDMMVLGAHNCVAYCMHPEEIEAEADKPKELYNAAEYPDVKTLVNTGTIP
jgi:hypothetical protein